jgi:acetyl esterase/lipase
MAVLLSFLLFFREKWPAPLLWILKLLTTAISPVLLMIGVWSVLLGIMFRSYFMAILGTYLFLVYAFQIFLVSRPPISAFSFEKAYGTHWKADIPPETIKYFLRSRMGIGLPTVPPPRLEQNLVFAIVPGSDRQLLCDVWQPNASIPPSGMAFIFLHGGAWYLLDKDLGTRPLFTHLAAQGHVIMDVAYRLAPETDMMGMVHDVQRAIFWMKENAARYGVNPDKIVVGGSSSGAQLALLTAYTIQDSTFRADDLINQDLAPRAVVSMYGPVDLEAVYYHTNQQLTTRPSADGKQKPVPKQMPAWVIKKMGKSYYRLNMDKGFVNAGSFAPLLGGHPDERPDQYALFSPITHVHAECPPTLLIYGEDDCMVPVKTIPIMGNRLRGEGVPVVMRILPMTDHAFDLVLPAISPSAHSACYDLERFLALQAK